jgi:hypothetical protein
MRYPINVLIRYHTLPRAGKTPARLACLIPYERTGPYMPPEAGWARSVGHRSREGARDHSHSMQTLLATAL